MRRYAVLFFILTFSSSVSANAPVVRESYSDKGINFLLEKRDDNPIISVVVNFKTGKVHDGDNQGLSDLYASLLDKGAGDMDAEKFAQELYEKSIKMSFVAGKENFTITLQTLSDNADKAFALLRKALVFPHFKEKEIKKAKEEIKAKILLEKESPMGNALDSLLKEMFKDHPYAHTKDGILQGVDKVTIYDLKGYGKRFSKENMIIAVSGDVTETRMEALLDSTFDFLPKKSGLQEISVPIFNHMKEVLRVKAPSRQSVIVFALPWLERNDKDFYASYVLNHIIGGAGLESLLMLELREKFGYTYSAGTFIVEFDMMPLLVGYASVDKESSEQSVAKIRQVLGGIKITQKQLQDAKDYLTGSFPLKFISTLDVASMSVMIQKHKLGLDYFTKRNDYINEVTVQQVNELAGRFFDMDKINFVIMGE